MRDERYSVTAYDVIIIYFKILIKHLNAEEKIDIAKAVLFNNYFN